VGEVANFENFGSRHRGSMRSWWTATHVQARHDDRGCAASRQSRRSDQRHSANGQRELGFRKSLLVALAATAAVGVTACGSSKPAHTTAAVPLTTATATSTPTQSVASSTAATATTASDQPNNVVFQGSLDLTDDAKYDYRFQYSLAINGAPSTNIHGDSPGQVTVALPVTAKLTTTNITPGGYTAPGAVATADFTAFYKATRPICKAKLPPSNTPLDTAQLSGPLGSGEYCFLNFVEEDEGPWSGAAHSSKTFQSNEADPNAGPGNSTYVPPPGVMELQTIPTSAIATFEKQLTTGADIYALTTPDTLAGHGLGCSPQVSDGSDLTIIASRPTVTCPGGA
jgi:hypothetical protein